MQKEDTMDWKHEFVLVTGGAGFLGSHLVERLLKHGAHVRVADNLERFGFDNLRHLEGRIDFQQLDLRVYPECESAMENVTVVFNLAAKVTGIEYNRFHHEDMFEQNMLLQMYPLKAAAKNKRVKKFVQVSTACIYPHDAIIPTPESEGDRGTPEPTNEGYGWAKRMGEYLARYYSKDMPTVVVRFFNAIGPRDHYDDATSHVVPAIIKRVFKNPAVIAWGSGQQTRSFVDARDLAKGLMLLAEKVDTFDIVNIGHGREITISDLIRRIQELCGTQKPVLLDKGKPDGYMRRACDTTKLQSYTGWEPEISLDQSLQDMIEDYRRRYEK